MAKKRTKADQSTELADILFPREEEVEVEVLNLPPEQRRLHTETFDFAVSTLVDYLEKKHVFVPQFQRSYVWSDQQASRLIESLIIQCPIPVLYFSQTHEEKYAVIDGNQRTNSIRRYINNEFALKGLTAYPELSGLHYNELDSRIRRHLLNRTLRCIVILKETHPQVQFDVFERLNTGSNPLNAQELRHGLYYSPFMEMLTDLTKLKQLDNLPNRFKIRMKTEELILRYFALALEMNKYGQPVSSFLNDFSKQYARVSSVDLEEMKERFQNVLEFTFKLFGKELTFRGDADGTGKNNFYVALFDAQLVAIDSLSEKTIKRALENVDSIRSNYVELFEDEKFLLSITKATPNKNNILYRIQKIKGIFNG